MLITILSKFLFLRIRILKNIENKPWFVVLANFHHANIPISDFKPLVVPEYLLMGPQVWYEWIPVHHCMDDVLSEGTKTI